ncbi:MAG TPA: carboxypeptidase-like regulatory domain-containing protein [Gemmataceae bacterium]|nr:carboxypeptidase-like regulatory domain-containing protein [Gemmataceae bacterium]
MHHRFACPILLLLGSITIAGCGGGLPSTATVSGKVTYQGNPVPGASVILTRGSGDIGKGEIAVGKTDANGRFELTTHFAGQSAAKGAVPGSYKVTVSKAVPPEGMTQEQYQQLVDNAKKAGETGAMVPIDQQPPPTTEMFPEHASREKTPLTAEIKPGKNDLDLAIK